MAKQPPQSTPLITGIDMDNAHNPDNFNTGPGKGHDTGSSAPHKAKGRATAPDEQSKIYSRREAGPRHISSTTPEANARHRLNKQGDPTGEGNWSYDHAPAGEDLQGFDPRIHLDTSGYRDLHREQSKEMLSKGHTVLNDKPHRHPDEQPITHGWEQQGSKTR